MKKATGIVRRIDGLGRIVVPKELRRVMGIREGDPLEIFTDQGGEIILRKLRAGLNRLAQDCADSLYEVIRKIVLVTDRSWIIAVAGASKNKFIHRPLTNAMERAIQGNRSFLIHNTTDSPYYNYTGADPNKGPYFICEVIVPIVVKNHPFGVVSIGSKTLENMVTEADYEMVEVAASFLSNLLSKRF